VKPPTSTIVSGRRALMALTAAWLAMLACSRSDVPPPRGIGSGGEPPQAQLQPTFFQDPLAAATASPLPAEVPTSAPPVSETPAAPEPVVSPTYPPTPTLIVGAGSESVAYRSQPGDALRTVAVRFGVLPEDIAVSGNGPPAEGNLLAPDTLLVIPRRLGATGPAEQVIPDSEVVYSPNAAEFDVSGFVEQAGGYLRRYRETVSGRSRTGAEVVELAARDHSVNPRLLLAFLEYYAGWVTDAQQPVAQEFRYPLGHTAPEAQGLYRQLAWLSNALGDGYYGWRDGSLTELVFPDSSIVRLAPELNAGTIALQYFFSRRIQGREWAEAVSADGLMATYRRLFGDPFGYHHPLYEIGLQQPDLILPFLPGRIWAFTGGPHGAWERESAWAALDFAPSSLLPGCAPSEDWVVASAPGLVVRSEVGVVVLDLDGDGREQTGWTLIYLHIGSQGRVAEGTLVQQGDLLGHPSCEGGIASGTHVHFSRKYNGEWILADGPIPFELSGWVAQGGTKPYQGALVKDGQTVLACACASYLTYISR
jgi:hypothetical protein